MKFEIYKDCENVIHFRGEVSMHDLARMKLSKSERQRLLSLHDTASDVLLDLEFIFRKNEEANA